MKMGFPEFLSPINTLLIIGLAIGIIVIGVFLFMTRGELFPHVFRSQGQDVTINLRDNNSYYAIMEKNTTLTLDGSDLSTGAFNVFVRARQQPITVTGSGISISSSINTQGATTYILSTDSGDQTDNNPVYPANLKNRTFVGSKPFVSIHGTGSGSAHMFLVTTEN